MKYIDDYCRKRGPDFNQAFLQRLGMVTVSDIQAALAKYFTSIFDANTSSVFISCHPGKLETIQAFLEKEGYKVIVEELEDESDEDSEAESDEVSTNESE